MLVRNNVKRYFLIGLTALVGLLLWFSPRPEAASEQGWHLLAIFVATIFGIVINALPMGSLSLIALCVILLTKTLTFSEAFSGFSHDVVWLIVLAFFVARGFIKTGLGARVSYFFMILLGKRTLGLGYGIIFTDLILAPAIPSSTARAGGLLLPIVESLAGSYGSRPHSDTSKKMGSYISQVAFHSSNITSAMFLTSMAVNPLIARLGADVGINITWASWALAACIPGAISLLLIPFIIYKLSPPEIKVSVEAPAMARRKLEAMGKISSQEWIMLGTFFLLLVSWVTATATGINPTVTAMTGLVVLILTDILTWKDIRSEEGAWETLVWFAGLLMMASELYRLGITEIFSDMMVIAVKDYSWPIVFVAISLSYFYSHYFFASLLAHISAMYTTFLVAMISLNVPAGLAVFSLAFLSSLFGCLTQYSCGPAAVLFGTGFTSTVVWWRNGFILSIIHLIIWLGIGSIWWKFLGIW